MPAFDLHGLEGPVYFLDDPVGRGGTGSDADAAGGGQHLHVDGLQIRFGFDMIGWFAGLPCNLRQPPGVAAFKTPDNDNHVHRFGQPFDFGLAPFGGITDGIKNFVVGMPGGRPFFYRFK